MNAISAIRLLNVSRHNFFPEEQVEENLTFEVYSKEEFHAILNCEKARADRNGHGFSIVSFESQDIEDIPSFIAHIKQRIRTTDEIGWFDHNTLGVFLYNTPARGAWQFVEKNSEKMDDQFYACRCSVFSYPNQWCAF